MVKNQLKIAILDLYEGEANEGMRCIKQLVEQFRLGSRYEITSEIFDVRGKLDVPGLDFDIYISSGGPGSPLTSEGSEWERKYFLLMDSIQQHNAQSEEKKFVFLICHSLQIFCRYYGLGNVSKRKSTAFGVMPIHKTKAGKAESIFKKLEDPFWAIDSRDFQITQPNLDKLKKMGGQVLCLEKVRPLIPLERAVMSIRFTNEIIGTQFHPEADSDSMYMYLMREDKKNFVIKKHGVAKYSSMLQALNDPEKIKTTYNTILPTFFKKITQHHDRLRQGNLQQQL
jgi:homoserine O-succinyltransferase/O-acetyltransferase